MLTYKEAQQILVSLAKPFGAETVPLNEATGRVLAGEIKADRDYPPFNRASMDGYAFNYDDFLKGITEFEIAEVIFAGQVHSKTLTTGQCYKIMTGAPVPPGANVVVRREDTLENDTRVKILVNECAPFQNIARQGEDLKANEIVISEPCICTPPVITLLASLGYAKVPVSKLPLVGVFTTGDEVVPVDQKVSPVQIRNSNRYLIQSLLQRWHITTQCHHLKDNEDQLRTSLEKALSFDMVIMSGGVSAGDADYVPGVLESLGVKKILHKVAIKPGKPLWCGQMPNGGLVFALPGNPLSCHVTFKLFIETYLQQCFGLPARTHLQMPLTNTRIKKGTLDEFFPVCLQASPFGVGALQFNGSGDISAALNADGLAVHPAGQQQLKVGSLVEFIPF